MDQRPAYVAAITPGELEQRYVSRQVTYLFGTRDTNPDHPALDKTCMAEAEGPYRYARGHASGAKGHFSCSHTIFQRSSMSGAKRNGAQPSFR